MTVCLGAHGYNVDKTALANFLERMYNNAPFEGDRVVEDYDNTYLLSVLSLDRTKYENASVMSRVASVKAMSQASRFFNGSQITSDLIINTTERSDGTVNTEMVEYINEHSVGFVHQLELLINFTVDGRDVFMYYKKIE